jgi:hypothetical protein
MYINGINIPESTRTKTERLVKNNNDIRHNIIINIPESTRTKTERLAKIMNVSIPNSVINYEIELIQKLKNCKVCHQPNYINFNSYCIKCYNDKNI